MIDFENGYYWIDLMNFTNIYGNPSTSLVHFSHTPEAISFDVLWLGGLLRLVGLIKDKEVKDDK